MLKMTRTQEQDRGLYSCLASNEAGEVRRNFSVEVLGMSQPVSMVPFLLPGCFRGRGPGLALDVARGLPRKEGEAKSCFLCLMSDLCSEATMELSRNGRDYSSVKGRTYF